MRKRRTMAESYLDQGFGGLADHFSPSRMASMASMDWEVELSTVASGSMN